MEATFRNNILVFFLFSILNTVLSLKVPPAFLDYRGRLYKERKWEEGGEVYQRLLKVKRWKDSLPELSDFIRTIFPRKRIASHDKENLQKYLLESCRAELTHWGIILSSFLFGFWNDCIETAAMILIALGLNLPYVVIQRYNRPRIIRLLVYIDRKKSPETAESGLPVKDHSDHHPCHILFISADDTGHGHKSIIEALRQQIAKLDKSVQVTVVDGFSLGNKVLHAASSIYNPLVVNIPALWGFFYRMGNHFVKWTNAFVSKLIEDKLKKLLEEVCPDVIVSVHGVFVGSVLNILEKERLDIPFIPIIADLDNVSHFWADRRSKYTLCPSVESKQTMLSLGIPEEKLKLVGFPVREEFCDPAPAKPKEGNTLAEEGASVLMINGSQGSRRIMKMAKILLACSNCRISIVAGSNASLKECLERELALYLGSRVRIYGFTKDIKKHMLAADILVVRASPNVLMEAVNLCKPVIVTGALKGQEEKNPEFVVRYNLGLVCRDLKKLSDSISELLSQNGKRLQEIYAGQLRFRNPHAAREIAEFIIGADCGSTAEIWRPALSSCRKLV